MHHIGGCAGFLAHGGRRSSLRNLTQFQISRFWGAQSRIVQPCFETVSRCFLQVGNQTAKTGPVVFGG
ncbi:unnamed protein product [Caretta caretta]